MRTSCPPDGKVLDPFCGSGTTALACYNLGRDCTTMDISKDSIKIATEALIDAGCDINTEE